MTQTLRDLALMPIQQIEGIFQQQITSKNAQVILGETLSRMARNKRARQILVPLAMSEDCLRVVSELLFADGELSDQEGEYIYPFITATANLLARCRSEYKDFESLSKDQVSEFLRQYQQDSQPFGYACSATAWSGLGMCRRLAEYNPKTMEVYQGMLCRLARTILKLEGTSDSESPFLLELEARLRASTSGDEEDVGVDEDRGHDNDPGDDEGGSEDGGIGHGWIARRHELLGRKKYNTKVRSLSVGTLFEIKHKGQKHLCILAFDIVVSLTNPEFTWAAENCTKMKCRVLDNDEVVTLCNR